MRSHRVRLAPVGATQRGHRGHQGWVPALRVPLALGRLGRPSAAAIPVEPLSRPGELRDAIETRLDREHRSLKWTHSTMFGYYLISVEVCSVQLLQPSERSETYCSAAHSHRLREPHSQTETRERDVRAQG